MRRSCLTLTLLHILAGTFACFAAPPKIPQEILNKVPPNQRVIMEAVYEQLFTPDGKFQGGSLYGAPEKADSAIRKITQKYQAMGLSPVQAMDLAYDGFADSYPVRDACEAAEYQNTPEFLQTYVWEATGRQGPPPNPIAKLSSRVAEEAAEAAQAPKTTPKFPLAPPTGEVCGLGQEIREQLATEKQRQMADLIESLKEDPFVPPPPPPGGRPDPIVDIGPDKPTNPTFPTIPTFPQQPTDFTKGGAGIAITPAEAVGIPEPGQPQEIASGSGGHKGTITSGPSVAEVTRPLLPSAAENVNLVREALKERVLRREITQQDADTLMEKITPVIQAAPDLATAFDTAKKQLAIPAPEQSPTISQRPAAYETSAGEAGTAADTTGVSGKETQSVVLFSPGVIPTAPSTSSTDESPKGAGSSSKDLQSALGKKNALDAEKSEKSIIAGGGATGGGTNSGYSTGGSDGATGTVALLDSLKSGLLASAKPKAASTKSKIQEEAKKFLEKVSHIFTPESVAGNALRGIASNGTELLATFEGFEDSAAVALAGVGVGSESTHPRAMAVGISVAFFFTAFSVTLIGFAVWHRRKQKKSGRS